MPFHLDPAALVNPVRAASALLGVCRGWWPLTAAPPIRGAVDPLDRLADLCAAERIWFHVDAAYGWSAVLFPKGRWRLKGIAQADSVTLDPHKWFGPDVRRRDASWSAKAVGSMRRSPHRPDYLQDVAPAGEDEVNFCGRGIALTRRFGP